MRSTERESRPPFGNGEAAPESTWAADSHEFTCADAEEAFLALLHLVGPYILDAMDNGRGELTPLPHIGTDRWHDSTDRVRWASVAVAGLEGLKLAMRSATDLDDYLYTGIVISDEIAFAAGAYQSGYDKGRRDQKAIDRRIERRRDDRAASGQLACGEVA